MIYVPPLHAELMSTTALTPTHHGGFIRTIASIAIAVAIPALAPSIALNIGLSSVIGNIAASALVGGALGALATKVTGGDWKKGAVFGAIGGGLGGYYQTPSGMPSYSTGAVDAGGLYPGGVDFVQPGAAIGPASAGAAGLSTAGVAGYPDTAFAQLAPGTFDGGFNPLDATSPTFSPTTSTLVGATVPQQTFGSNVIPVGFSPQAVGKFGQQASAVGQLPGGYVPRPNMGGMTNVFASPEPGFLQTAATQAGNVVGDIGTKLSGFAGDVGDRIVAGITPENVAEGLSQLATSAFAETAVDKAPVSPEEIRLRGIRDKARQEQQGYDELKAEAATKLFKQAGAISPEQRGQELHALEQARYGRAQQAGLRRINPRDTGAVTAYLQQGALRRSRLGGYGRGQESGRKEVIDLYGRGIGLLPTGDAAAAGAATDLAGAKERYDRLQRERENAGYFARTVFGGLGTRTEEERERLARGQEILTS